MPRHYQDPPQLVHPHVFATWAKNGELHLHIRDGDLIPVEAVSVVQTTKTRQLFISYLDGAQAKTVRFKNPVIEDTGMDWFRVTEQDNPATRGLGQYNQVRVTRIRMPPALLCPGCEVCRS